MQTSEEDLEIPLDVALLSDADFKRLFSSFHLCTHCR